MYNMFREAHAFNSDISRWDVSRVQSFLRVFYDAQAFNVNIGGWGTGNVVTMKETFQLASSFDQPIGGWATTKVTDMTNTFRNCPSFDQDLGSWDTTNVETFSVAGTHPKFQLSGRPLKEHQPSTGPSMHGMWVRWYHLTARFKMLSTSIKTCVIGASTSCRAQLLQALLVALDVNQLTLLNYMDRSGVHFVQ
ncbi:Mycoplasma protein of unknown function, DUF285 [Seminavis robusta]|uniref:BspA family leucine-rich repeat surface protein n=1 Tax=Seminavis robusta TaxID=568900 RepID=A0A9N8DQ36_9STRA|nr:Mycoplasma protein of unknown function, DUF285 [Seminavis robusta]|eukprot:Sro291_g109430.1 Mycoplasma protein of unknown function, DUF285 (193) ;mRNA; f:9894-10736